MMVHPIEPVPVSSGVRRILLVDDHDVVREGLREIFASTADISVAAEATTGDEAITLLRTQSFDGAMLDLSLPDRSGIDVLRRVRTACPTMPVLVFSMHPAEQYALSVIKAGASGYLMKCCQTNEVLEALRTVLSGGEYLDANVKASIDRHGVAARLSHERLTTRELEVFCKLAAGLPVSAVADEMNLSVKTISTHRASILMKMDLKTNTDLAYYAIKNGLMA